jgi:hypothetical protein
MSTSKRFPTDITYQATDCVVAVRVIDHVQAAAVESFAKANDFACPASPHVRPVYHCSAKTHPNDEVLWA